MSKQNLRASISFTPDNSPGGILATSKRILAKAAPTATGITLIAPDGTVMYVSRADADNFANANANANGIGEARQ